MVFSASSQPLFPKVETTDDSYHVSFLASMAKLTTTTLSPWQPVGSDQLKTADVVVKYVTGKATRKASIAHFVEMQT